jgi:hypothetical protein
MGVSGQRHAPAALLPPGKGLPVPIVQEAGWFPEPVWTQRLEEKSFAITVSPFLGIASVSPHNNWSNLVVWVLFQSCRYEIRRQFMQSTEHLGFHLDVSSDVWPSLFSGPMRWKLVATVSGLYVGLTRQNQRTAPGVTSWHKTVQRWVMWWSAVSANRPRLAIRMAPFKGC